MKRLLGLALALLALPAYGQDCHDHLQYGIQDEQGWVDRQLCRWAFAVGYSDYHKTPLWVAYRITKDSTSPTIGRRSGFLADRELPPEARATDPDYKYSGFDRGHMAPSATVDFSREARDESYQFSNITPQDPGFNRGGWRSLEAAIRRLTDDAEAVFVVTGALYESVNRTIGRGVAVPSHLYKVVYIPQDQTMAAWIIPNASFSMDDLHNYQVKVDTVENRTGLDFFPYLRDRLQKRLESTPNQDLIEQQPSIE